MASPRSGRTSRGRTSAGDTPSTRASARAEHRAGRRRAHLETASIGEDEDFPPEPDAADPVVSSGVRVTRRFVAVAVVAAVLVISLASSLRVYVNQRSQMAQARAAIAQSSAKAAQLQQEEQQWSDPDYVRTQARDRLGWVLPGESGYQVVDGNGQPYGGGSTIDHTGTSVAVNQSWWQRLWGSVQAADQPTPSTSAAPSDKVVTVTPSSSSSASTPG